MTWYGTAVFIAKRTPQRSTVPYSDLSLTGSGVRSSARGRI